MLEGIPSPSKFLPGPASYSGNAGSPPLFAPMYHPLPPRNFYYFYGSAHLQWTPKYGTAKNYSTSLSLISYQQILLLHQQCPVPLFNVSVFLNLMCMRTRNILEYIFPWKWVFMSIEDVYSAVCDFYVWATGVTRRDSLPSSVRCPSTRSSSHLRSL